MNTIVKDFERHLFEDGKSTKTIESYVGDVASRSCPLHFQLLLRPRGKSQK